MTQALTRSAPIILMFAGDGTPRPAAGPLSGAVGPLISPGRA